MERGPSWLQHACGNKLGMQLGRMLFSAPAHPPLQTANKLTCSEHACDWLLITALFKRFQLEAHCMSL